MEEISWKDILQTGTLFMTEKYFQWDLNKDHYLSK